MMNLDTLPDGVFHVWQPNSVDLLKGEEGEDAPWRIGGYASTEALDRQGEVVLQKSLDFSEFVNFGWFNDNHQQHTAAAVGVPEAAEYKKGHGWWTEGYLLKEVQRARDIYQLAKALVGTPRKLGFSIEGKILERLGNKIVRALIRNVAVTNSPVNTECLLGDTQVLGTAEKVSKRSYSGPMVEVVLATGEKISGTPNHPVLTQLGWVPLGSLDEITHFVGCVAGDRGPLSSASVPHHVDDVPSVIEQVFNLALVKWSTKRIHTPGEEHLDSNRERREINVVPIDGELHDRLHAAFTKKFGEHTFSAAQLGETLLPKFGSGSEFALGGAPGPSGALGGSSVVSPLSSRETTGSDCGSFTGTTQNDSGAAHEASKSLSANTKARGYRERALASSIRFSNIVSKRTFEFTGHVFNLQTKHEWYHANGIVVHNCTWGLVSKSFADDTEVKALSCGHARAPEGGGRVLVPEDLEKDEIRYIYRCPRCQKAFGSTLGVESHIHSLHMEAPVSAKEYPSIIRRAAKSMSADEAVTYLRRQRPEYSEAVCRKLVEYVLSTE